MKNFVFLSLAIILAISIVFSLLNKNNNEKKALNAVSTEVVEEANRALIGKKIVIKTISGKEIEIQRSKYKKGYWISKGDKIFILQNEVIINGESYDYY